MDWTLKKAASEFGVSFETIRKGLAGMGVEKKPKYSTREIFHSISGDLKFERTRETRANADKAEVEAAIAKKSVIPKNDVTTFIRETFSPVREQVVAMPGALAAQCNPTDPTHARGHLQSWVDMFLKQCREHLPESHEKD